jgi:hypothetical protein
LTEGQHNSIFLGRSASGPIGPPFFHFYSILIPSQKVSIFFENRKVLELFRFSYKIAKTANSETALTSDNTWIWRLKFGLRVHNELYSILFTHFFDFKRKWFHMCRANAPPSVRIHTDAPHQGPVSPGITFFCKVQFNSNFSSLSDIFGARQKNLFSKCQNFRVTRCTILIFSVFSIFSSDIFSHKQLKILELNCKYFFFKNFFAR